MNVILNLTKNNMNFRIYTKSEILCIICMRYGTNIFPIALEVVRLSTLQDAVYLDVLLIFQPK